jgi:hypothetical protein
MKLYQRIEQILLELRPVFSREATFEWFLLLFWGALWTTQPPGVTSYVNAMGLSESYYHQAFESGSIEQYLVLLASEVCNCINSNLTAVEAGSEAEYEAIVSTATRQGITAHATVENIITCGNAINVKAVAAVERRQIEAGGDHD